MKVKLLSRVRLLATPWTAAYHVPPSVGFSRQEYWSGVPLPSLESEEVGLKLNIQKTKIMASGPITSWQINGEIVETVADFIFWGSKITVDGDCTLAQAPERGFARSPSSGSSARLHPGVLTGNDPVTLRFLRGCWTEV